MKAKEEKKWIDLLHRVPGFTCFRGPCEARTMGLLFYDLPGSIAPAVIKRDSLPR